MKDSEANAARAWWSEAQGSIEAMRSLSNKIGALIFFFSSRRRHTRLVSDWSSDVCSSDLCERKPTGRSQCAACTYRKPTGRSDRWGYRRCETGWCRWRQIGRASCRERVWVPGVAGAIEEKKEDDEGQ